MIIILLSKISKSKNFYIFYITIAQWVFCFISTLYKGNHL